jgi:hypothetical protein
MNFSILDLHRNSSFPKLSCSKLAPLQSRLRLCHARCDNDTSWKCHPGKSQQGSNKSGITWSGILEDRHFFWHRGDCHGLCQSFLGKCLHHIFVVKFPTDSMLQSYIFRDTKIGLNARQVRSHGAVAEQKVVSGQSSRKSFRKSFILGRKDKQLPSYYSNSVYSRSNSPKSEKVGSPLRGLQISNPTYNNPEQFSKYDNSTDIATPNLAHHPAMYSNRV